MGEPQQIREIIGRVHYSGLYRSSQWLALTVDHTVPDYAFWDLLRRCKQHGYEFGALFAERSARVMRDWVLGKGVAVQLAADADPPLDPKDKSDNRNYTNDLLKRFMNRIHALLLTLVNDLYGLGDQYVIVNRDGSLSVPSPDTVAVEYDPADYRRLRKVVVTTKLDKVTITDTYTDEARYLKVKTSAWKETRPDGTIVDHPAVDYPVQQYPNLIGRIPIVHFANERSANETHGHPIHEALRHLFSRYNDLLEKALDGAELMGNPIPTFQGVQDVNAAIEQSKASDTNDEDKDHAADRIEFSDRAAVYAPQGSRFELVSPATNFTADIRSMLKLLFLLVLDNTGIPEVIWGNELSSARASAVEQMETFYMSIHARRVALEGEGADTLLGVEARGGLLELVDLWLRLRSLTDPRVVVAPCVARWGDLGQQNSELRQKWVEFLDRKGYITPETAVRAAEIVEDAEAEVQKASASNTPPPDAFEQALNADLQTINQDLQDAAANEPQAA